MCALAGRKEAISCDMYSQPLDLFVLIPLGMFFLILSRDEESFILHSWNFYSRTQLFHDTRTSRPLTIELMTPSQFHWGPKFICDGDREDTITGVVLLTNQLLVTAHREAALLFNVQFDLNRDGGKGPTYQILDVQSVYDNATRAYHHPDLLKVDRFGRIYSTFFSNAVGVFHVNQASKSIETVDYLVLGNSTSYHGVAPHPTESRYVLLAGASEPKPGLYLADMEAEDSPPIFLGVGTCNGWYAKDVHFVDENSIVALFTSGRPQLSPNAATFYDSRVVFLELMDFPIGARKEGASPSLKVVDSFDVLNGQVDSCAVLGDSSILVTLHDCAEGGKILKFDFSRDRNRLELVRTFPTDGFPHGIAYTDGIVAYTTYSTSKVFVHRAEDFAARE